MDSHILPQRLTRSGGAGHPTVASMPVNGGPAPSARHPERHVVQKLAEIAADTVGAVLPVDN
jgi:hypothetical protein